MLNEMEKWMIKNKNTIIIFIIIFLLFGCSKPKVKDPIATDSQFTNQQIKLYSSADYNTYSTKDVISAEIWNLSGKEVKFPNNYNIKIYEYLNDDWKEISEKPVTRLPSGNFEFNPNDGSSNIRMIGIFPDLPDINQEYYLRIYVSGKMVEGNKEVEVTAYIDVKLKP
ncbi:MAG: hypothetical protein VB013_08230 [Anaerolineaceae bacterium]|jgi:hypothetical protein|nr:hypothetical protein [Anaerolineaceae bacterium]